ncbi:MAG: hypothetical protein WCV93_04740 [Candidatus Shapirobacteria bacterium]|jgi:hypothetical protein
MAKINPLQKKLTLARLETQSEKTKVNFASGQSFTKDQLINEVESETVIGRKVVDIQVKFLQDLAKGKIYQDG